MKLCCNFCNKTISKKSPTTCYLNGKAYCDSECRRDYGFYGQRLDRALQMFKDPPPRDDECRCKHCTDPPPEPSTEQLTLAL